MTSQSLGVSGFAGEKKPVVAAKKITMAVKGGEVARTKVSSTFSLHSKDYFAQESGWESDGLGYILCYVKSHGRVLALHIFSRAHKHNKQTPKMCTVTDQFFFHPAPLPFSSIVHLRT